MKLDCVSCHGDIHKQTKARYEDKGNYCDKCIAKANTRTLIPGTHTLKKGATGRTRVDRPYNKNEF